MRRIISSHRARMKPGTLIAALSSVKMIPWLSLDLELRNAVKGSAASSKSLTCAR